MSTVQKIAHNTIIQIIGKIITIALALVAFGITTRYLGQEGFGYYSTVYAFLTIFGILVDLGMQMTTTQLISDPKENESEILSNALTVRLITSLIFLGLAPLIILFFPYPEIVKVGVMFAALGFVFSSLSTTLTSLFQKHLIIYKIAIAEIVSKISFLVVLGIIVFFNLGLLGILGAIVLDSFLVFAIMFYFASKQTLLKPRFQPLVWQKIFKKTWPIALTIALNLVYFKGDILIMSLVRPSAEVGLYGAPYKILEVLINLIYGFAGLILPFLATAAATQSYARLKIIIQSYFDFLIILSCPMIIGGFFIGEPLMTFVAGPDFAVSGDIMKILLLATATIFVSALFGYVVVALDQQKKMIKFYAINAIISLIGYLIFIPIYSYWGAAWMTVFTEFFILLTAAYVMYQNLKFIPNLKIIAKATGASLVMAIPLYFLSSLNFLFLITIAILVYFPALFFLEGFDKQTLLEIVKIKQDETPDNQS